ncbi:hypothetical protein LWI29_008186 [Acer saccharum]|uniref:Cation/H+ exchanger transmembrane domain-containing protein n=1 Tax=Acer saccharum TaxID=4024 RepID=A0AA39VT55_ACESA|nr:hypothetical protein LWI29_008186 [Acer saccharum]
MSILTEGQRSPEYFSNLTTAKYMACQAFTTIINDDSKGIWFEDYLSNTIFPLFMVQLILSFFFSKLIYYVLRPLKQPKFVSDVLTGMILGPSVMGCKKKMMNLIFQPKNMLLNNTISAIAGIYFIFINSVKMDKSRILPTAKKSWHVGLTCFIVPWVVSVFVYYQLQDNIPGIVKGNFPILLLALSCLSFIHVIVHSLGELNLLTSELGNLAISSATVYEIIGWCLLSLVMLTQGPTQGVAGRMMGVKTIFPCWR